MKVEVLCNGSKGDRHQERCIFSRNTLVILSTLAVLLILLITCFWQCCEVTPEIKVDLSVEVRSPWEDQPEFIFYLRFTSGVRWESEYKDMLIRTMKIFVPEERAKLLVVLDKEKKNDHELGERLQKNWPYPMVCYRDPGNPVTYHNYGKSRMFWDMMYPDGCTEIEYVGYIDTDTFFSTFVTPNLLFENGKPIIVAKIGKPAYGCWVTVTEAFLKKKEVLQCMSTFPVMVKTEHMKEMRSVLSREQGKPFDEIFRDSTSGTSGPKCLCQFSIMCNYLWYYHRDEYVWHLQMVPDGKWRGQNWLPGMAPVDYFFTEVKPWMKIPIPRTSIHLRYTMQNGAFIYEKPPPKSVWEDYISEGLCYSAGFDFCPDKCKRWDANKVHYNLYAFEGYEWFWDDRCYEEQVEHYKHVKKYVEYAISQRKKIFGLSSIHQLCSIIK